VNKQTESVLDEIGRERYRQVEEEGWTLNHDDKHEGGELALASGCYALRSAKASIHHVATGIPLSWPWARGWWKPTTDRRNLVKAGALIVAEIERLDRIEDGQ